MMKNNYLEHIMDQEHVEDVVSGFLYTHIHLLDIAIFHKSILNRILVKSLHGHFANTTISS